MKTQPNNFFQQLDAQELQHLVQEVKETVAQNLNTVPQKPVFGAVDFWNFQRMRRNRIVRRHLVA